MKLTLKQQQFFFFPFHPTVPVCDDTIRENNSRLISARASAWCIICSADGVEFALCSLLNNQKRTIRV